ncbi:MAG: B12-binding domain-containing radical SAM protein [Promethearchaeota archaeon]
MNSKTIILIRPDFGKAIEYIYRQINPPIGLGYLASFLKERGFRVYILDLALRRIERETVIRFIKKKNPLFVGISALTAYYSEMKLLSNYLREKIPSLKIILGGVHASSLPRESLVECHADFAVIGEGELSISRLARYMEEGRLDFKSIPGICFFEGEEFIHTGDPELISDLDSIPMPAWHKINPNKYPKNPHGFLMVYKEVAPLFSTRGCPFECHYCASCRFWQRKIRFRSSSNVVDEIQYLHEEFGIREIHFWDDNLTLKRSHIEGICNEIIRRGLDKLTYCAPNGVRVDTLDEKLLILMKKAGFYKLTFAVESGSSKILRTNGKYIDLKKIIKNTVIARNVGFMLNSFFMIGFPGETEETIKKTVKFAKSLPFNYATFFLMKPLPGSKIFDEWSRGKELLNFNWNNLSSYMQKNKFLLSDLSPEYLSKAHKKAHNEFIYRIKMITSIFWISLRHFHVEQFKFDIERFMHLILGFNSSVFS